MHEHSGDPCRNSELMGEVGAAECGSEEKEQRRGLRAPSRPLCSQAVARLVHGGAPSLGRNARNDASHSALLSRYFHTIASILPGGPRSIPGVPSNAGDRINAERQSESSE